MKSNLSVLLLVIFSFVLTNCNRNRTFDIDDLVEKMELGKTDVRNYSTQLANRFPGEFNIDQICEIHNFVKSKWKYVNDPKGLEYFSSASNTIANDFTGDCDDFAILLASLIQNIGGEVRFSMAYKKNSGHAFTEVRLNQSLKEIRKGIEKYYSNYFSMKYGKAEIDIIGYRTDEKGNIWVNLDWFSEHVGGIYYDYDECKIFYPDTKKTELVNRENNLIKYDNGRKSNYTQAQIEKYIISKLDIEEDAVLDVGPFYTLMDINNDRVPELIVYYTCCPEMGNICGQRLSIFKIAENEILLLKTFELIDDTDDLWVDQIQNGMILCKKTIYTAEDPHCCPSYYRKVFLKLTVSEGIIKLSKIKESDELYAYVYGK